MVESSVYWKSALAICIYFNAFFCVFGIESSGLENKKNCTKRDLIWVGESYLLPTENCDEYIYNFYCSKSSSIISITVQPESSEEIANSKKPEQQLLEDGFIDIIFKENATLENEAKSLISTHKWTITPQNIHDERLYLSRTSRLQMNITVKGDWSNNALKISSQEEKFNGYEKTFKNPSEVIKPWETMKGRKYRPNSVFFSHIDAGKANSININLNSLDIDVAIGEYLLIGSGTNPFEGPPPLFIASKPKNSEYKIFDNNAYIVFVSHSTNSKHEGFEIIWSHDDTPDPDEDLNEHFSHDDVLQSVQICIYNKSAAFIEFSKNDSFMEFRAKVSEIATNFAKEYNRRDNIKPSQVEIFRVSDVIREDPTVESLKAGGLYVMVKIKGSEKGTAAFRRHELENIIETYYRSESSNLVNITAMNGTSFPEYKIESCPPQSLPNIRNNIVFYAIIPVLCCILLVIWGLKHSRLSEMLSNKMKGAAIQLKTSQRTSEAHAENVYTSDTTVPKVRVICDHGRRRTLVFEDLDSDVEVYNKNHHFKRPSIIDRNFYQKGNTNGGFVDDEECSNTLQLTDTIQETQLNETEHFYDTVKSDKSVDETKL